VRILYLCHRIPYPPDKGDKIRAYHQVRALAAKHEVDVFTLADDPEDLQHEQALRERCGRVVVVPLNRAWSQVRALPYLLTKTPLTLPFFYSARLRQQIRKAVAERAYDRIVVYCSAMVQYCESGFGIPVVTDLADVDSDKWKQYAASSRFPFSAVYRREGKVLQEYERQICENSACVVVTTEREAQLVRGICPTARIQVIPNGVDTEYFQRPDKPLISPPVVGFMGNMSYYPNQGAVTDFARKVFPLIRQSVPDARFLIVGRNPGAGVERLREIDGVEVTGFVPDVRPYLARMWVSVAPLTIAAGIQNKILEAMASELPVVGTARAVQGLTPNAAKAVETAGTPQEMAARIVPLLRDPALARGKGRESRRIIAQEYNWGTALGRFLQLVENPAKTEDLPAAVSRLS
jgi:sugar transferase (PEP-CTERM/EpsH1 system associated)